MRYRSVAMAIPKTRSNDIRRVEPKRSKNNAVRIVEKEARKIKGSGVLEDGLEIYNQKKSNLIPQSIIDSRAYLDRIQALKDRPYEKKIVGKGLKLAGGAINLPGGEMMSSGNGLDLPGGALKMKLIKESRGKDIAGEYSLKNPSIGMGLKKSKKLKGMGDFNTKGLDTIQNLLSTNVIPKLMDKMGVGDIVPQKLIDKVVEISTTSDPSDTIKDVIKNISDKVLPIITQSKLAQTGSGKHYRKIIKSKNYKKLHIPLKKYIKSQIKGQDGEGFFGDLWSGFKSVIKPLANIAAPIASFVFPEFAAPIGMATKIIGSL